MKKIKAIILKLFRRNVNMLLKKKGRLSLLQTTEVSPYDSDDSDKEDSDKEISNEEN